MFAPSPSAPSVQQWSRYEAPGSQHPTTGVNPYALSGPASPGITGVLPGTLGERMPMMQPTPSAPSAQQWDRYGAPGSTIPGGMTPAGPNPFALGAQQYPGVAGALPEVLGERFPMA